MDEPSRIKNFTCYRQQKKKLYMFPCQSLFQQRSPDTRMPLLRHQPSESQALTSVSHKLSAEGHEGGKGGGGVLHVLVLLPGHLAAVAVNVEGEAHADRQLGRLARERQASPSASVLVLFY
jgi:hypothetical protein